MFVVLFIQEFPPCPVCGQAIQCVLSEPLWEEKRGFSTQKALDEGLKIYRGNALRQNALETSADVSRVCDVADESAVS